MMTGLPIANEGGLMSVVLQQFIDNFVVGYNSKFASIDSTYNKLLLI